MRPGQYIAAAEVISCAPFSVEHGVDFIDELLQRPAQPRHDAADAFSAASSTAATLRGRLSPPLPPPPPGEFQLASILQADGHLRTPK